MGVVSKKKREGPSSTPSPLRNRQFQVRSACPSEGKEWYFPSKCPFLRAYAFTLFFCLILIISYVRRANGAPCMNRIGMSHKPVPLVGSDPHLSNSLWDRMTGRTGGIHPGQVPGFPLVNTHDGGSRWKELATSAEKKQYISVTTRAGRTIK